MNRLIARLVIAAFLLIALIQAHLIAIPTASAGTLSVTPIGDGSDIATIQLQNERPGPNGSIIADVVLTNKKAINYNMSFTTVGNVYTSYNGQNLFDALTQIARTNGDPVAVYPVASNSTRNIGAIEFPPGSQLVIKLSKFGDDPSLAATMMVMDIGTLMSKVFGGIDVGQTVSGNISASNQFRASLLSALSNAGFDLAAFYLQIQNGDITGALQSLIQAVADAPTVFASILKVSASTITALAQDAVHILQAVDAVPEVYDLTFAPSTGGFEITNPTPSQSAIVTLPKSDGTDACLDQALSANDDGSTDAVPLPFTADFFGNTYGAAFLNNNGNITFNSPQSTYTPYSLLSTRVPIIAPFFGDVDTRGIGSGLLRYSYGDGVYAGHSTLCVDWVNVGYFGGHTDKLNSFQLLLVDRSDTGAGNFDIMFNYNQIQWESGDASGGSDGLGGSPARVGYSNGVNTSFELPGSGVSGSFLDSNPGGLIYHSLNSTVPGRYIFEVRNGVAPTGGAISGHIFGHSSDPANAVSGAFVQVCGTSGHCNTTLSDANGAYEVSGLSDDSYTVTAFPPGGSNFFQDSIGGLTIASGNTLANEDIILQGPEPLPNNTTITDRYVDSSGIPVLYWQDHITLTTHGCAGGAASYQITLADGTLASSGGMTEGPSGTYTASIAPLYPNHGNAHVAMTINCPNSTTTNVGFDIYIDPSGTVVDDSTNLPISNATVTLLRSDTSSGPFTAVPNGSGIMSLANRNNPDQTDVNGHYGWDVASGYYEVQASAPGYTCNAASLPSGYQCVGNAVESNVLTIPPAVFNLTLPLHSLGGSNSGGGSTATPELSSSELALTGIITAAGLVLVRRRRRRQRR